MIEVRILVNVLCSHLKGPHLCSTKAGQPGLGRAWCVCPHVPLLRSLSEATLNSDICKDGGGEGGLKGVQYVP